MLRSCSVNALNEFFSEHTSLPSKAGRFQKQTGYFSSSRPMAKHEIQRPSTGQLTGNLGKGLTKYWAYDGQNKQGSDTNIEINDQLIAPPEPDCSLH